MDAVECQNRAGEPRVSPAQSLWGKWLEGEFSYGLWESYMAECIIAILSSPYLAAQQHWAQLALPPPTTFFSLLLFPPTSPAALLSLPEPQTSECTRAQFVPLWHFSIFI